MRTSIHTLFACALALSGVLAAGCDEPMDGRDGGTNADVDGSTSNTDGGGNTDHDGGLPPDGGGSSSGDCASYAAMYCESFESCNDELFIAHFESMAICVEVTTESCMSGHPGLENIPMLADPIACAAARGCPGILGVGPTPEACVPPPGPGSNDDPCSVDAQCGMGTRWDGATVRLICAGSAQDRACGEGRCFPPEAENASGNTCQSSAYPPCNHWEGQLCVTKYDSNEPDHHDGRFSCWTVEYGDIGDPCRSGTNKQCKPGLVCDNNNRFCMAALQENQSCSPTNDLCDKSHQLSCVANPDPGATPGSFLCMGPDYANVGQQCETFDEGDRTVTRNCSYYADCREQGDGTQRCELKKRLGENCDASPDNCWPGLICRSGTCQEPDTGSSTCD